MENQDGGRLASFRKSIGFAGAYEDGFSGSSSHRGGQPNMLIGLTELDLWEIQRELSKLRP